MWSAKHGTCGAGARYIGVPSAIEAVAGRGGRGHCFVTLWSRGMGIWNADGTGNGFAEGRDGECGSRPVTVIVEDSMVVQGIHAEYECTVSL